MSQVDYEKRIQELEAQLKAKDALIQSLQSTTDQYFALLEKMPSLAWIKDQDHKLTYINPAFEAAFGIKRETWIGKSGWDLFPAEQAQAMANNDQQVFDSEDMICVTETVTHAEHTYYYLSYKFPFIISDQTSFIAGISIDITHQVEAEQELTASYKQLQDLQKAKDKFIGLLSHDLKSPLSNLVTASQMLEDELQESNESFDTQFVKRFRDKSYGIIQLLDNLIKWYHQENRIFKAEFSAVEIDKLLQQSLRLFDGQKENKQIHIALLSNVQQAVMTDDKLLATVIRNLLSNAIKFSPVAGTVTIESTIQDNQLTIRFQDQGQGIEDADSVFDNIWKSRPGSYEEEGHGFGLALSKEIMQQLNGELSCQNLKQGGAEFSLRLPLSANEQTE